VKGVDLNSASAEEMLRRLAGVGLNLARRIENDRHLYGPFLNVHDLSRVQGLGRKNFERITGKEWREDANVQREKVKEVLGGEMTDDISIPQVADRFAGLAGFDGCILVDNDGDLLATSWSHESNETLGVFAPQFLKKLAPYVASLGVGEIDLMTVFISERAFTMIPYKDLIFVAVHETNRFSRRQLRVAQQVANSLGRLLFKD
jgi:competence ComEA-like helix-hairpin-helix protein